jgi:hypothetical protein
MCTHSLPIVTVAPSFVPIPVDDNLNVYLNYSKIVYMFVDSNGFPGAFATGSLLILESWHLIPTVGIPTITVYGYGRILYGPGSGVIRCGSATCPARCLRYQSQFRLSTKYFSPVYLNIAPFFHLFFRTCFTFTYITFALFLSDSLYGCTTTTCRFPGWINLSKTGGTGLLLWLKCFIIGFWVLFYICMLTLLIHTDNYLLRTTYRQCDGSNHFGHLGLRRGLTSRWIGHPPSTLLRASESPYSSLGSSRIAEVGLALATIFIHGLSYFTSF